MFYVVETDALCEVCGDEHGYATSKCDLAVFVDEATARSVAKLTDGICRTIERVPTGISYTLFIHRDGKPDPRYPRTVSKL